MRGPPTNASSNGKGETDARHRITAEGTLRFDLIESAMRSRYRHVRIARGLCLCICQIRRSTDSLGKGKRMGGVRNER